MDLSNKEVDVYALVSDLCKRFLDKYTPEKHPYLPQKDNSDVLKKLRIRAFEILLKKSPTYHDDIKSQDADPVAELLKYSFVLKTALRRSTKAQQLENSLALLTDREDLEFGVYSALQFLNGLKSFEIKDDSALNIFHYGQPNPLLPEELQNPKDVPKYQIYPLEAFVLPEKFEAMLGLERTFSMKENSRIPYSSLSLESRFGSTTTVGIEALGSRSDHMIGSLASVPRYTVRLVSTREFSLASYFTSEIMDENERRDSYSTGHIDRFPGQIDRFLGPEPPWLSGKQEKADGESISEISDVQSTCVGSLEKPESLDNSELDILWEKIVDLPDLREHRNWEYLGQLEAPKEPSFITETSQGMLHLEKIKQACYLPLLPRAIVESLNPINEISLRDFLESVKLLLLGVESTIFVWHEKDGFELRRNTTIPGLSVEALESACTDVINWGGCYRLLSILIKPDPKTNKMLRGGLIFRAMCNSVKELLVYYQAVILRIGVEKADESTSGLLKFLMNVKPVGSLIAEVARLCRCDRNSVTALSEGLGLLSHIYEQVTRVTKPSVALVFYSILKSCCEVYFRLLQKWLFEGICDDDYGEFMIKIRPQFLRERTHRFWTKGFAVNGNSVPGFLSHLADSILDCGKTVRLLKTCDPKNPICAMFATSHPAVRVCLSVGMVREQEILCRDFLLKGEDTLGRNISFSVAFEDQRAADKDKVDLVIEAQRETLLRIKKEREEAKKEIARGKRELLAQLKDQAEEVASRKEREREAELLKDKQFLEDMNAADELAKIAELAEKKNVLNYYNELAEEAERRRVRADWRLKRMKLFQERVDSIDKEKKELFVIEAIVSPQDEESTTKRLESQNLAADVVESEDKIETNSIFDPVEDVNKNLEEPEVGEIVEKKEPEAPDPTILEDKTEKIPKKSPRPCVLEINKTKMTSKYENKNVAKPEVSEIAEKEKSKALDSTILNEKTQKMAEITAKKSPRPCVLDINKKRVNDNLNEYRETRDLKNDLQLNSENAKTAERNKLKVLEQEYGMTPNNNELNIIVLDAQGNENTICIDATTVNPENLQNSTKMIKNRNLEDVNLTDAQKNRNKNMSTNYSEIFDEFIPPRRVQGCIDLTDAEKNRKKNMSHTYNEVKHEKESSKVNFSDYTELQRNRARVMSHDQRNYHEYDIEESDLGADCLDPLTPLSPFPIDDGVTPMSCTTDTFPISMTSSITQLQNGEDDFPKSGMRSTTTPGDLGSEDPLESRPGTGFHLPGVNQAFPNFFGLEAAATPIFESSLTVADVEMIDNTSLQVYLEKSVTIPLRIQSRLANAAIIKYMLHEEKMLSHLHSLRSFYFLLNGEFAKSLTSSLYKRLYEISVPLELFRTATLTNILENAINSSFSNNYANSQLLSLSATDIPTQLQVSNPEYLNCLSLNYKISWPLNIMLDERLMHQYSKVFKFLLMVGRVFYVLREDFHILKIERKAATSNQYHKLQLYRHAMMQFITALHNYLTCSVLHASWAEFEKDLESATTLDQIYLTHVNYIRKILSRCMLTARGEKMRNFLCNIFKVILKFHNRVRSQNWSTHGNAYSHGNFEKLEQMYETFCEARTYLAHVANKLASSGYQPHLTHFLNALNINNLYDLTDMNSSKKS